MARAKCKQCRDFVNTNDAVKGTINKKTAYWCSEQCKTQYEEAQAKVAIIKAEYDEIIALTREIFGYNIVSLGLLRKEINTWETLGTRQKIIAFLRENKDWLSVTMRKEFPSEFNRVRYYATVVASKLHDFKQQTPEGEKPKVIVEETVYEAPVQSFNKRRSLADLEDIF